VKSAAKSSVKTAAKSRSTHGRGAAASKRSARAQRSGVRREPL
jgi:hypothetical protein